MKRKNNQYIVRFLSIALTLIIGIGLGMWQATPPLPPGESSAYYPAYQRMLTNIENFTRKPHTSGSAEIEKVRGQIIAEIEDMGLTPIVEEHRYTMPEIDDLIIASWGIDFEKLWAVQAGWWMENFGIDNPDDAFARWFLLDENGNLNLHNILVKLESPGVDSAILFLSHYDSAPESPGASDSMQTVCAQLEALRSHANNTNLQTNIYFLFTDAEEQGMLGAWAFVAAHPEMKEQIDVIVDMDSGGGGGLVFLGQISPKYSIAQMMLKSGARPLTSSLAIAIGSKGTTNFEAFRQNGYDNGVSFDASFNKQNLHTPADSYQNMDKATAWHFLHIALSLADYAANNSLASINDSPREGVYFPFFPRYNVLMTLPAAYMLAALPCILALAWAVLRIKTKRFKVSLSNIVMGLLMILTIVTAAFFIEGNYLFSIPLLVMAITKFLNIGKPVHFAANILSGIIALMLWTPFVYLLYMLEIRHMI